jgi:diguanylate cyclase (GGDEF)-like protein
VPSSRSLSTQVDDNEEAGVRTAIWRRYLLAGLAASTICVLLPRGVGRDVLYCLIGLSGAAAILVGVRLNRPARPAAWYVFATGTAAWALADVLYGWYHAAAVQVPFPSLSNALYLAVYPMFATALLLLGRRRRAATHQPTGLDETALLTISIGLLAWVFLVEPIWTAYQVPLVNRIVGLAYPFCGVLLLAMLTRLMTSATARNAAFLLVAGSVGALIAADTIFTTGLFLPVVAAHTNLLDFGWLLSYVLWGAAALHPSMRELSSPQPARTLRLNTLHLTMLGMAAAMGPVILGGEMITRHPVDVGPVIVAAIALVILAVTRVSRVMRLLDSQTRRLSRLAHTDYVTGLVNRRYFEDRLGEVLNGADPEVNGILFVHLERLAGINDTLGQPTADAILRTFGARLAALSGEQALVARMGNDLFGVLDPSITSGEGADRAAVATREGMELPLELPDLSLSVEVSVGALVMPEDGAEPDVALFRADVALSVARGRPGRTACYGTGMTSRDALAPALIGELAEAIEHSDIVVHYQPQVELCSGRVLGVEALVRWQHPSHGLLEPDTFIPSAEQTGLIGPLTQYVLDSALEQSAHWRRGGLDLTVAVNLSVRNLLDPDLVDEVRAALETHGVRAGSLELEITESSAMVNLRRSVEVLGALAELGVRLSIDDYGTGHSSLAYLQKLPVGRLKIDRSLVTGMTLDPASAAIVDSTIKLARALHFEVVAEGVEDDETLLTLRDMKCSTAQGFDLGPPVTASLLPGLVTRIEERLTSVLGTPGLSRARPVG